MDLSSQVEFINGKSSAVEKVVSELNSELDWKHASDEKVLENHKNLKDHMNIKASNGNPSREPEDLKKQIPKMISKLAQEKEEIRTTVCDPVRLQDSEHIPDDVSKCSSLERVEAVLEDESKKASQSGNKKRGRPIKGKNMLTSSPRVLRLRSQDNSKIPELDAPVQDAGSTGKKRRKKKKKQKKNIPNNEFLKIRTHLRYLLNRMNYEQNFIDAYVGEGWKGQSLEKIRPEKELERAKSNIFRYKLKIRDLFQQIDTSFEEGRLPESLFDSEGEIDSEDIFCAKCGLKDVKIDNDIILCDGACERGFHQFCLNPPLLKEQVPPGDEGWLCPACDCKVDCIDLLNDSQGVDLSISDSWEKVFPEAVASGDKLDDISGLPSDDSEDDDYNPDGPEMDEEVDGEESSSDESDFSSASEDLEAVANNEQYLGLPSEDSEDDDYDPERKSADDQAKSESSSSDFTSDSENLSDIYKDEGPAMAGHAENNEEISNSGAGGAGYSPITAKRHVERLDYKKLHDETYGNVSSDSSDEDFTDTDGPRRRKNTKGAVDMDTNPKQKQSESTPKRRTPKKLEIEGTSSSPAHKNSSASVSIDGSNNKSPYKRLGEAVTQRLHESFKVNRYPDRDARENLAKELNLTFNQVNKWFVNARWSFNHPGKRIQAGKPSAKSTSVAPENAICNGVEKRQGNKETAGTPGTKQANKESPTTPKSRKRKGKADDQDSAVPPSVNEEASPIGSETPQGVRRSGRIQSRSAEKSAS